jgi:glucose-1-phosphate thymidylyltransferase
MKITTGVIMAGGNGTRLHPLTFGTSKQLLPLYNQPLFYYSLYQLISMDIRKVYILVNFGDYLNYYKHFGYGENLGIDISYIRQETPEGIAQVFHLLPEDLLKDGEGLCLILGDNIFLNYEFNVLNFTTGCVYFGYRSQTPEKYGCIFKNESRQYHIVEKPINVEKSVYSVPGIYFFDSDCIPLSKKLKKSARKEYEITHLLNFYNESDNSTVIHFPSSTLWFDTGNQTDYEAAGLTVKKYSRTPIHFSPYRIALEKGFISPEKLKIFVESKESEYFQEHLKIL